MDLDNEHYDNDVSECKRMLICEKYLLARFCTLQHPRSRRANLDDLDLLDGSSVARLAGSSARILRQQIR